MKEIKQLIEEEAEKLQTEFYAWLDKTTAEYQVENIATFQKELYAKASNFGYNLCLQKWQASERWRKFGTDGLPRIGQLIVVRGKYGHESIAPKSHQTVHWLAETYTEWKPIND